MGPVVSSVPCDNIEATFAQAFSVRSGKRTAGCDEFSGDCGIYSQKSYYLNQESKHTQRKKQESKHTQRKKQESKHTQRKKQESKHTQRKKQESKHTQRKKQESKHTQRKKQESKHTQRRNLSVFVLIQTVKNLIVF